MLVIVEPSPSMGVGSNEISSPALSRFGMTHSYIGGGGGGTVCGVSLRYMQEEGIPAPTESLPNFPKAIIGGPSGVAWTAAMGGRWVPLAKSERLAHTHKPVPKWNSACHLWEVPVILLSCLIWPSVIQFSKALHGIFQS